MKNLSNIFSDPDKLKFTEALNTLLKAQEPNYTQAMQDLALLLHKGISEEQTQRLLHYLSGENDRLVKARVVMLLASQPASSASVIDFFRQMTLANQIPDYSSTILILQCFIRNGIMEHIAPVRHLITSAQNPGEMYMYALQYGKEISTKALSQLLKDKDLIDAFPPAAWDALTYAENRAISWGVQTEFEASYLAAVLKVSHFLARHEGLIKEGIKKAGTEKQLLQDLATRHQPMYSFTKALENNLLTHLFFTESRTGLLELQLLAEQLQKNENLAGWFPASQLNERAIQSAGLDQYIMPVYEMLNKVGKKDNRETVSSYLNSSSGVVALANDRTWIDRIKNHETRLLEGFWASVTELVSIWNPQKLDQLDESYLANCVSESEQLDEHLSTLLKIIAEAPQQAQSYYVQLSDQSNGRKHNARIIQSLINDKNLIDQLAEVEPGNLDLLLQAAGQFTEYFEGSSALANSYLQEVHRRNQYIYESIQREADYYLKPIANALQAHFNQERFTGYLLSREGILALANHKDLINTVHAFERWSIITLESNFISILSNWNIDGPDFLKNTYLHQRLQLNKEIDRVVQDIHSLLPAFALSDYNLNDSYSGNIQLLEQVLNNQPLLDNVVNRDARNLAGLKMHSEKLAALWGLDLREYFAASYLHTLLVKATEYREVFAEVSHILRLVPEAGQKHVQELGRIPHTLPSLTQWTKRVFEDIRLIDSLAAISENYLDKLEEYLVPLEEIKKELAFTYFYRRQNFPLFMRFWEVFRMPFLQKNVEALMTCISFPLTVEKYWFDKKGNVVNKSKETVFAGALPETLDAIHQSSFQVGSNNFGPVLSTTFEMIRESRELSEENKGELTGHGAGLRKAGLVFRKVNGNYLLTEAIVIYRE